MNQGWILRHLSIWFSMNDEMWKKWVRNDMGSLRISNTTFASLLYWTLDRWSRMLSSFTGSLEPSKTFSLKILSFHFLPISFPSVSRMYEEMVLQKCRWICQADIQLPFLWSRQLGILTALKAALESPFGKFYGHSHLLPSGCQHGKVFLLPGWEEVSIQDRRMLGHGPYQISRRFYDFYENCWHCLLFSTLKIWNRWLSMK